MPIVGVGLFYKTGYFRQSLNRDGWQQEDYPVLDPDGLPLSLLRDEDGAPAGVTIELPGGRELHAHIWRAQVGRVPLLLLDSDVHENDEAARSVTERLYGGGGELRLQQEMLLGMGGVRALRLWSQITGAPTPDVYHANEGHAGFLGVERISELVRAEKMSFDEALEAVRGATVFTTHTPVPAGIDRFDASLIELYFGGAQALEGVPVERLLRLGAETYEGGSAGMFNMAVMGLRLAQRANGVSQLHGVVSREMFDGLWPGFDDVEVPITSITNGVHGPTWVDRKVFELARTHADVKDLDTQESWEAFASVPRDAVWATKRALRLQLVEEARRRTRQSWLERGASPAELAWTDEILDPDVLTIGFARRVPTYKRLTLMLRDPVRLKKLLLHPTRPVQLVIAGKSHPADETGKQLIQQLVKFADDPEVRHRIVFLPNYDIAMALHLYPGCDVWLNNPLRPFEACGTSGMKAALNGALNLSILDGWWDEWFDGKNGWAIPTADGVEDPERRDDIEAARALRARRAPGRPAVLRHRRERPAAELAGDDAAHHHHPRAEGAGQPDGARLHREALRARGPFGLGAARGRLRRCARPRRLQGHGARRLARRARRPRRVLRRRRQPRARRDAARHDLRLARRRSPPTTSRCRSCTGAPTTTATSCTTCRRCRCSTWSPTSTVATSSPATWCCAPPGAFGYTVRVLPKHDGLARPSELGLVANA